MFYYKKKDGTEYKSSWEEIEDEEYEEITEDEFNAFMNSIKPQEDLNKKQIAELKHKLAETDYLAIKYAEGWLSEAEYAKTKSKRQKWRDEINELEKM